MNAYNDLIKLAYEKWDTFSADKKKFFLNLEINKDFQRLGLEKK